jgi:3-deoxy-D-manno-octulosonic-acid transferase
VARLQPDLAIFVKYEFWRHHLQALQEAGTPTLLISAIFRQEQVFFKFYGGWYRGLLRYFQHIFTQDDASGDLLRSIDVHNFSRAGDTRVDRVLQLREQAGSFPEIARFAGDAPVWVAGSTWPVDEAMLFSFWDQHLPPDWKVIMAPHDIAEDHILQIESRATLPTVRYSQLGRKDQDANGARVLLIDNIGMLSALYQYGKLAYIGGGFGKAIHNLLEPIAFGLPVIFGPRHEKFQEALALKRSGGGYAITGEDQLLPCFERLQEESAYAQAASAAISYLRQSQGSTEKILQFMTGKFPDIFKSI